MPFQSKRLLTTLTTLIALWAPACSSDPALEVTTGNEQSQAVEVSNPDETVSPSYGRSAPLGVGGEAYRYTVAFGHPCNPHVEPCPE